jgi:IS605 OrfB family transposase
VADSRPAAPDEAAFKSKNLYNAALYVIRQKFIFERVYFNYQTMDKLMQSHEAYKALPTKVSQQVLKLLDKNWQSFFESCKVYKECPEKFTGRPKLPKYKHKTEGRNILIYTLQAIGGGQTLEKGGNRNPLRLGLIQPSQLPIAVKTKQNPFTINQVRIVPRKGFYVVEIVYEKASEQVPVNPAYYAGVDIGVNTLATLASNKPGFVPRIVNGRPLKSINQFYNKRRAELQHELGHTGTTKRIDHYMHTVSKRITNLLVKEGISTLVIGKNDAWKQEANMGKRTNQNFVQIPHARFISMLTYKAELVGITVKVTEESYTSKASLLDLDPLPARDPNNDDEKYTFSGKRIKRGLYRAQDGRLINADCNGSGNIIRKVAPDAFSKVEGVEDGKVVLASLVVHPVRFVIAPSRTQKGKS